MNKMTTGLLALGAAALLAAPSQAQRQKDECLASAGASLGSATTPQPNSAGPNRGSKTPGARGPILVAPGGKTTLYLTLRMKNDYHIYDPKPGDPYSIPTTFTPLRVPGVTYGTPIFPKPTLLNKARVHGGDIVIKVPVSVSKSTKGAIQVGGTVKLQACNERGCLPPFTLNLSAPLLVGK